MLETHKSAKTPSTPGIPNSRTTAALLETGAPPSVTLSPKVLSRSRANSSACASRSRLINRPEGGPGIAPEVNLCAMAAECPPAPSVASTYVPSGLTRNHSSTSSNITGVCGSALFARHSPLATRHFLTKFPNLPAPCRPRSCTARSSSYPQRAYGSSPRDNRDCRTHRLLPSSAPIPATLREPKLCPARPAPPFALNSSCPSSTCACSILRLHVCPLV